MNSKTITTLLVVIAILSGIVFGLWFTATQKGQPGMGAEGELMQIQKLSGSSYCLEFEGKIYFDCIVDTAATFTDPSLCDEALTGDSALQCKAAVQQIFLNQRIASTCEALGDATPGCTQGFEAPAGIAECIHAGDQLPRCVCEKQYTSTRDREQCMNVYKELGIY